MYALIRHKRFVSGFFHLLVILTLFLVHDLLRPQLWIVTEGVFYQETIFLEFPWFVGISAVLLVLSVGKRLGWSRLDIPRLVQLGLRLCTLILAWNYLFYDFNFYFDQWHTFDRILVAVLAVLSCRYPILIFPLLFQINLIQQQFNFPFGGSSFLDKKLPYAILELTAVYALVHFLYEWLRQKAKRDLPAISSESLIYLLIVVIGASYFHPGWEKVLISPNAYEWALDNRISNNLVAMFHRGWLETWPVGHELLLSIYNLIEIPGQVLILAGELLFITALFNRKFLIVLVSLMLVLHVGVFFMNGALFWMWMFIDCFMLTFLFRHNLELNWKSGVVGIVAILWAPSLLDIPDLGWYDSPLDNRFEARTNNDVPISEASFSPYTQSFQYGNFLPLVDNKTLQPGFLQFEHEGYITVSNLSSTEVLPFIEQHGTNRYNPEIRKNMERFLHRFLSNGRSNPLKALQPFNYWNAHLFRAAPKANSTELDSLHLYHLIEHRKYGTLSVEKVIEMGKKNPH